MTAAFACFLDFDDTIVSIRKRDHAAYVGCLPHEHRAEALQFDDFKTLRLQGVTIREMLLVRHSMTVAAVDAAVAARMELFEHPELLKLDHIFEGTVQALNMLQQAEAEIFIVSARLHHEELVSQCERLELTSIIPHPQIFSVGSAALKHSCVIENRLSHARNDVFVGDSVHDIHAGLLLGIRAVGVSTGLTSRSALEMAGAHSVCVDISSAISTMLR